MSRKGEIKSKLYRCLKTGPKDLDELQQAIGTRYSKKEISQYLDILIKERWVERHAKFYMLKYELHAPIPIDERDYPKYWDYERIQEDEVRPATWTNPFLDYILMCNWHEDIPDYRWKGHDWGSAGRYLVWLKQLESADPLPEEDKIPDLLYDLSFDLNGWVDNYAEIHSFEGIKDAIYNCGCAIVKLNLYDNLEQNYRRGEIPEPACDTRSCQAIGSYVFCAVGYDTDHIYFLNPLWGIVSSFSWKYYERAAGKAFTILDPDDAAIGKEIYGSIHITTNVPCEIWIGKYLKDYHLHLGTEAKVSAEIDKTYTVVVLPLIPTEEEDQSHDITPTKEKPNVECNFVFTPYEESILQLLYNYLNKHVNI